jgi:plasmid stabilization system protein ParE
MAAWKNLNDALDLLREEENLHGYAALAAAQELARNWEAALADGANMPTLAEDVDRVIGYLRAFKQVTLAGTDAQG